MNECESLLRHIASPLIRSHYCHPLNDNRHGSEDPDERDQLTRHYESSHHRTDHHHQRSELREPTAQYQHEHRHQSRHHYSSSHHATQHRQHHSSGSQQRPRHHQAEQGKDNDRWQMDEGGLQGSSGSMQLGSVHLGVDQGYYEAAVPSSRHHVEERAIVDDDRAGGGSRSCRLFDCPNCAFVGECTGVEILKHRRACQQK